MCGSFSVYTVDLDGDGDEILFHLFSFAKQRRCNVSAPVLGNFGNSCVIAADLDGDGDEDLAATNESPFWVEYWLTMVKAYFRERCTTELDYHRCRLLDQILTMMETTT